MLSTFVRFMHISYLEAKSDYEGTLLGIAWIPLSTLIFSLLLALVFRVNDSIPHQTFFLYVLSGYVAWNFISDSISRSTAIIQTKFEFAVHNNLTLAGLFGKTLADRFFELVAETLLLLAAVIVLAPQTLSSGLLLAIPLTVLLALMSVSLSYVVNLITMLFPDLSNVVRTGVRLMFFATPVFWMVEGRHDIKAALETYNPASYYLMMFRQVFGVQPLSLNAWLVGSAITLVITVLGALAYWQSSSFVRNLR
jgi:lipopolysaccharide transport system permease protein